MHVINHPHLFDADSERVLDQLLGRFLDLSFLNFYQLLIFTLNLLLIDLPTSLQVLWLRLLNSAEEGIGCVVNFSKHPQILFGSCEFISKQNGISNSNKRLLRVHVLLLAAVVDDMQNSVEPGVATVVGDIVLERRSFLVRHLPFHKDNL